MRYLIMFFILYLYRISHYGKILAVEEIGTTLTSKQMVRVGVILDLDSPVGKMAQSYISMALSDFYARNANYRTKLTLSVKNCSDDVAAASTALELIKKEEVQAIIGPQTSSQAKFVINLGDKAQIPIISFSATSPTLSPTQNRFFIRTALDYCSQVKAITSIVEAYRWPEVVVIYEDTEYGNGLIPYITDAFQQIHTRVPYRSVISPLSSPFKILMELNKLMGMETRVFLVHMTASLESKVFKIAKDAGMMREGYAWIITAGLSTLLHPVEARVIYTMEGVMGVRPYVPMSKGLKDFKLRLNIGKKKQTQINLFGLWAYDTVWALAKAAEMVNYSSTALKQTNTDKSTGDQTFGLNVSNIGRKLLKALLHTRFKGLSGEFRLTNGGQLQPAPYEIINVVRKEEKVIPPKGRVIPIWPGNTSISPKGWVIPVTGNKLRIGVPVPSDGFTEFVNMVWSPHTDEPTISGFSIDVFLTALSRVQFPVRYKFIPYMNSSTRQAAGTYDKLLYQIKLKKFDAVVGDTTIVANRASYVDFTLPYSESGVWMAVKVKDDERKNIWIFLKPLSWDLWLTSVGAFIFTGVVVWFLEHRINTEFSEENVVSNWTRLLLIIWIFVVLILTQSYSASLASMLTVERLQPAVVDASALKRNGDYVGYHKDSFVKELLKTQLNFEETKLKNYTSPEEYHEALSKGSKNGGVDAIFEEIPYVKIFLSKYCSGYTVVGPTYKTAGFGFAFPLGSPLVSYISRAILNVTQDYRKMEEFQHKYLPNEAKCQDPSSTISSVHSPSLSVYSFGGLFIITAVISISSCLVYIAHFLYKHWPALNSVNPEAPLLSKIAKRFYRKDSSVLALEQTDQAAAAAAAHVNAASATSAEGGEASPDDRDNLLSRAVSSNQGLDTVAIDEQDE